MTRASPSCNFYVLMMLVFSGPREPAPSVDKALLRRRNRGVLGETCPVEWKCIL